MSGSIDHPGVSTGGATTVELPRPRGRRRRPGNALTAHGEPMVWLTGGALAICLIMILGLLALVLYQGVATFWPGPLTRVDLRGVLNAGEGRRAYLGEITRQETYFLEADNIATMTDPGQRPLRERAIELLRPRLEPALARLDDTGRLDYAVEEARQAIGQINAGAEDAEFANAVRAAVKQVNAAWSDLDRAPFTRSMDRGLAASRSLAESLSAAARAIGKDVQAWRERELGDRTPRPDALSEVAQHPQFRAMERLGRNIDSAQRRVAFLRRQMRLYRAAPDVQQAVRDREDRDFLAVLVELKQSDDPGQAAAAAVAMDAIEVEHSRRLFRTANFDLTRTHFHWIPDFAIAREREPNWAVVVERLRGGRYQGEPTSFAQRTERRPGERERRLAQARTLITQGMAMVDRSQRGPMMAAYTRVNQRLAELRAKASRRFVDRLDIDPDARLELKLQTGKTVASDQWDRTTAVREAIEVWTGPEAAWAQMKRMRDEVLDRREQHEQIKEHQIGRVNQRMSDARLALRGAALAYDKRTAQQRAGERGEASNGLWDVRDARRVTFQTRLVGPAKRLVDANRRLATIREENGKRAELIAWVNRTQDANDPVIAACRAAAGAVDQRAAAQVDEVEQQIAELQSRLDEAPPSLQAPLDRFLAVYRESTERIAELTGRMKALEAENARHELRVRAVQGHVEPIAVGQIVRAYPANQVAESLGAQMGVYFSRWGEFLTEDPRQANSEGGIFPAIVGTVLMTIIMAFAVVPFGVMAALYLREYAKAGFVVSTVRIAINNLAGVPSIVFGVFGLGFFCYVVGDYVDAGPVYELPAGRWFAYLGAVAGLAVLGAVLFMKSLARPGQSLGTVKMIMRYGGGALWMGAAIGLIVLVAVTPFFDGFFEARKLAENQPTFGKGALVWASLTLALLTLPVVIVATEEALSAVPNSMREGSYACGASKWQTIKRIVLPRAMPGIMTGMILAMARGAGEVAPLMLVGAVKLAPELPITADASEAFGINRSFMHLGFHIYDLGFQSQDSEAAKPMVFTTTLLLIAIVAVLNLSAIWLRTRLRQKFIASAF